MVDAPAQATETSAAALAAGKTNFDDIFEQLVKDESATVIKGADTGVTADDYTATGDEGGEAKAGDEGGADAGGEGDSAKAEDEDVKVEEGLPTPEQVAAEAAAAAEAAKTAKAPEPKKEAPAAGPAPESWKTFEEVMRDIQKDRAEALKTKPAVKEPEAPKGPEYTKEETEFLEAYRKDWGDLSKAEELIRREEYKARDRFLVGYMAEKFIIPLQQQLQALQGHTQQTVQQSAYQTLKTKVPDYDEIAPKVVEWVGTLPPTYKAAYASVAKEGTIDEVMMMIDHYRSANNIAKPAAAAPTAAEVAAAAAAAAPASKKVLNALKAPVTRRTTAPVHEVAANDFQGAFDAFADEEI